MRLVSLCPSLTELVFALGRGEDLVGITTWCVHPAEEVGKLEKVGGTKNPRIERIVELRPDLVLLNEEENRLEDAQALEAAGIRCHTSFPKTVRQTARMVRSIGEALGRGPAAEAIAADIEGRARQAGAVARGRRPLRFSYLIWRKPWMTVNADTYVHDLLTLAGGDNVFAHRPERYPALDAEQLRRADPEAVLLATEPFPFADKHIDELVAATTLPRQRFHIADGELLSWHGSRTPDGIDYAVRLLKEVRVRLPASCGTSI